MTRIIVTNDHLFNKVAELLTLARKKVVLSVNTTMVQTYFEIGKLIVEEEQHGKEKAKYGQNLINELSRKLSKEFGKGFSPTNIKQMRSFYLIYSKGQTPSDEFKLSWSHYLKLMRINNVDERKFYEIEAYKNNWSLKELQRQYDTALYTRLSLSRDKKKILELSEKGLIVEKPRDTIKDPYILEFIGLPENNEHIFASKYQTVLPSREKLKELIEN